MFIVVNVNRLVTTVFVYATSLHYHHACAPASVRELIHCTTLDVQDALLIVKKHHARVFVRTDCQKLVLAKCPQLCGASPSERIAT